MSQFKTLNIEGSGMVPNGEYVRKEDYDSLHQENESNLKSAQYAAETNRKVVRTNEVLSDKVAALQQKLDAVLAENVALKDINAWCKTEAFENMYREFKTAEAIGCPDVDCMHDAMLTAIMHAPEIPATDTILNAVRAEGIHFAANRMLAAWDSGFIDDTPAQAYDISGAVLSAVEFLPNASPEEFKRDFADAIRREIKTRNADAAEDEIVFAHQAMLSAAPSVPRTAPIEPKCGAEWVKVSERMPRSEPGMWSKEVAAVSELGDVFKLSAMGNYWQRSKAFVESGAEEITHWMPLPAAPEEK